MSDLQRLFGPFDKVGVEWPDLVELKAEIEDVRIQNMVAQLCQAVPTGFDCRSHEV